MTAGVELVAATLETRFLVVPDAATTSSEVAEVAAMLAESGRETTAAIFGVVLVALMPATSCLVTTVELST